MRRSIGRQEEPIWRFLELKAGDVMHDRIWELPILDAGSNLDSILSVMRARSYIWVVDDMEHLHLLGIIELVELLRYFLPPEDLGFTYGSLNVAMKSFHRRMKPTAGDIMDEPVTCDAETPLRDVINQMVKLKVWRIAVTDDDGRLIGEVTQKGLVRQFYHFYRYG